MYRRFMTRLLSSSARLSKHALRLGHRPKVTLSKVWPGQLAHLAPPPPGARSRVWPSRLGVTTPFRGCCPVCLQCPGGKAAAPLRQGLTAEPGLAAERSQSRRRSTARSMAWAREVTPSFW
jgi:hypothetical protein